MSKLIGYIAIVVLAGVGCVCLGLAVRMDRQGLLYGLAAMVLFMLQGFQMGYWWNK